MVVCDVGELRVEPITAMRPELAGAQVEGAVRDVQRPRVGVEVRDRRNDCRVALRQLDGRGEPRVRLRAGSEAEELLPCVAVVESNGRLLECAYGRLRAAHDLAVDVALPATAVP